MGWHQLRLAWWHLPPLVLLWCGEGGAQPDSVPRPSAAGSPSPASQTPSAGSSGTASAEAAAAEPGRGFARGWLDWKVPTECPDVAYVEGRIVEWLGAPPLKDDELSVKGTLRWDGAGWNVHVRVLLNGRVGERSIVLQSCSDAADFVALAVALSVDPELSPEAASLAEFSEKSSAPDAVQAEPEAAAAPDEASAPGDEVDASRRADAGAESKPALRELWLLLGLAGELSSGALPGVAGGLSAGVGLHGLLPRTQVWLSGRFLPGVESSDAGAAGPVAFSLLSARLTGCVEWSFGRWAFGPCLAGELGAIQAGQTSGSVVLPGGTALWVALAAGLQVDLRVSQYFRPFVEGEVLVPLVNTEFLLNDGSAFYRTAVGFRAALGVSFFFDLR